MDKDTIQKPEQSFLKGAFILTMSMVLVRIIGALFKIPMASLLGGEGNGYFNSAYELYFPIFALATGGFPIAISKMVSERLARGEYNEVRKIRKISVPIFIMMGIIGFIAMIIGTFMYCGYINSPGVKYSTFALAPMIFFACVMSIYRGYYQGLNNMVPTAVSEIIEALCKLIIGYSFAWGTIHYNMKEYYKTGKVFGKAYATESLARGAILPIASAAAISGIAIGSLVGFIYLFLRYKIKGDGIAKQDLVASPKPKSGKSIVKELVRIAIPIGLGALIMNIASFIDASLVQRRLNDIMQKNPQALLNVYGSLISKETVQRGVTHTYLYGCLGYANTIMMLVPAVSQALGISALPPLSMAWAQGNKEKIKSSIEGVLKIASIVTIPISFGIAVLSHPIMDLLYGYKNTQSEISIASNVLIIMGIAAIFTSISTPICSMLQAIGRVDLPVKLLSVGLAIKIVLNYTLVGIPEINIQGAGTGSLVCYLFVMISTLYCLCKEAKIVPDFVSIFIKPILAGICCAITAYISYNLLSNILPSKISTLIAIVLAGIIYTISLFLFRAITADDIKMLPNGKKIKKLLEKYNIIG